MGSYMSINTVQGELGPSSLTLTWTNPTWRVHAVRGGDLLLQQDGVNRWLSSDGDPSAGTWVKTATARTAEKKNFGTASSEKAVFLIFGFI